MASDCLRGHHVLRRGVYAADRRAEGCGADDRIHDTEPGIRYLSVGGMGDPGAETESQTGRRLCVGVRGDHAGAASREAKGKIDKIFSEKLPWMKKATKMRNFPIFN